MGPRRHGDGRLRLISLDQPPAGRFRVGQAFQKRPHHGQSHLTLERHADAALPTQAIAKDGGERAGECRNKAFHGGSLHCAAAR